ncbi:MAG: DoxX family protein [Acidobacteriota bacterium]
MTTRKKTTLLWTVQGLLALLFAFAGTTKLVLPLSALAAQFPLPGALLRFVGLAEVAGALGLILPGVLRIRPWLTPLAAAGLAIIMIGATVLTLASPQPAGAVVPALVGVLAVTVAYHRGLAGRGRRAVTPAA